MGGAFRVTNSVDMSVDTTPPIRVTDLRVTNLPDSVRVEFTAPGDDLDSNDKAGEYIIKYSSTAGNLTGDAFNQDVFNMRVKAEDLVNSNLAPVDGGQTKTLDIKASLFAKDRNYVMAMKALDTSGNESPISNKVQIFIPPYKEVIRTTTTQPSSGCSDQLLFSTDSYPSGKLVCYDDSLEKTTEETLISPGTTCMFLSAGHLDHGFAVELFCQEDHWVVDITGL